MGLNQLSQRGNRALRKFLQIGTLVNRRNAGEHLGI
jgi:hypothetical protein